MVTAMTDYIKENDNATNHGVCELRTALDAWWAQDTIARCQSSVYVQYLQCYWHCQFHMQMAHKTYHWRSSGMFRPRESGAVRWSLVFPLMYASMVCCSGFGRLAWRDHFYRLPRHRTMASHTQGRMEIWRFATGIHSLTNDHINNSHHLQVFREN